jgi:hypothetical protein
MTTSFFRHLGPITFLTMLFLTCSKPTGPDAQCEGTSTLSSVASSEILAAAADNSEWRFDPLPPDGDLTLGTPLHVYFLSSMRVDACTGSCKTASLVCVSTFWYVPVTGHDGSRAYFGIDEFDDGYTIVMCKSPIEAYEKILSYVTSTYGIAPVIIKSLERNIDFYSVPSVSDTNLTPYSPDYPVDSIGLMSTNETLGMFRN